MKKVYIYTEGACWKRLLDANKIRDYFIKNNYKIVKKPKNADIIFLVTCTFLNGKSENSLNKVKEFQRYNAELVVGGCLPVAEKEKLERFFNGKTVGTKNLDKIDSLFPDNKIKFSSIEDANILFQNPDEKKPIGIIRNSLKKLKRIGEIIEKIKNYILNFLLETKSIEYKAMRKQFHVRISWGCTGDCSYCTIKKSTGPFHSKPFNQCIEEFRKGLKENFKHFVLDATDVGAYGIDIGSSFPELLDEMTKIPGDFYITIREIHTKWIIKYIDELEEILKRKKILILDIAIQSSNKRILKLMNRPTTTEKMKEALLKLKKYKKETSLTCEFIIGFPTETEEEFKESLRFIEEIDFNGGQLYSFSCRTGTEAEQIEPKISNKEMVKRLRYTKRFLKKAGYKVIYFPFQRFLVFSKKS